MCQRGWDECAKVLESLELAIAAAHRNDGDARGAACSRVLHCPRGPLDHFSGRDVRGTEQHEGAQIDLMASQEIGRLVEPRKLQPLVEVFDCDRVNCFETYGDFEPPAEQRSKFECHRANRTRV